MCLIFVAEVPESGEHRIGSRLSQTAERIVLYIVAELFQLIQIRHVGLPLGDLCKDLQHTLGADPAGGTFAAGFLYRKFKKKFGNIHHTVVFIHNDQAAGAHHGADGNQIVIVNGNIKMFGWDTAAGGAAGLGRFEFLSVWNTASDLINNRPQRSSHGNFYQPRVVDLAAQGKYLGSLGFFRTHGSKPFGAV